MDQSSDKPKEIASVSGKADAQETFIEGVLTRNRTSSITKSVPRPRTRSLSGSSQSDILASEPEKQSPSSASLVKRTSVTVKPDQLAGEIPKGRRRRRTKAQIAADNAAKEEFEKKEVNLPSLPITKKTGRPRGRPKKVRTPVETPVETPSSTVTNSPTPSLQNEEPLPPLITSSRESLESPNGDQDAAKLSNQSSYDFDAEQPSIDNVTALPPTMSMTLLKKEELTLNEDTPLLKEDVTPSPVAETKTPHGKDVMVGMEEQSKEEWEKVATKTTEPMEEEDVQEDSSSQPAVCSDNNVSTGDAVDGGPTEQLTEKPAEEPIELMDISPSKARPAEVPSKKPAQSSADAPTTDSVTDTSSNFPTNNDEVMDTGSTSINTATVEDMPTKICLSESNSTPTTLTNAESTFADSFLTTCAVTAVTSTSNNATSFTSLSSSGTTDTSKNITKTVSSVATVSSSVSSSATSVGVTAITKTTTVASTSVSTPSSTGYSTASSCDAKASSSAVPLGLLSASVSNNTAKTVATSSVPLSAGPTTNTTSNTNTARTVATSNAPLSTTANTTNNSNTSNATNNSSNNSGSGNINARIEVSSSVPSASGTTTTSATTVSKNSNRVTPLSAGAVPMSTDNIKSVAPSVISIKESSSYTSEVNSIAKSVTSTVVSSTASSVATSSLSSQSITSTIPAVSLNTCTTTSTGTATVGSALSKISSQSLLHNVVTTVSNTSVASTAKPSVTTTATNTTRDVAKLDPLPINLNTSLSVTLPTLSSLLTTPSGQQKLVLPLEKLVLPSSLETSASTTGPFISPPPVSKPSHSCSYVITSMQMKDTDPVSLAVSTMAQPTKENSLHSTASQKVTSTSHGPIIFSSMASLESKKTEPISVESKLREIAPKTLGLEFHQLPSDISRSSGVKKPELYEVLSNFNKVAAANRSLGSSESKSSSFMATSTTVGNLIGQNVGKEKFDQTSSGHPVAMEKEQQHKPRPIAIKPDGMDLLRQMPGAVATSSRTYPTVHPLFPLPTSSKTANLMTPFDLFRNVPTTQKQYSAAPNISASVLPHLPGSSIAAYSAQKAPPPLISITDGPSQTVLGSVRVKVIDAPASAHQSSLSSLPAHMKVNRQRPLSSQQPSVSAPVVTTNLVSVTGSVPAPLTTYSTVSQQQYIPHPLTIGVHASSSSKVPSTTDVVGIDHEFNICLYHVAHPA